MPADFQQEDEQADAEDHQQGTREKEQYDAGNARNPGNSPGCTTCPRGDRAGEEFDAESQHGHEDESAEHDDSRVRVAGRPPVADDSDYRQEGAGNHRDDAPDDAGDQQHDGDGESDLYHVHIFGRIGKWGFRLTRTVTPDAFAGTGMTERAVVVGASSGIGRALAHELAGEGYEVGLTARRTELLKELGEELPTKAYVATMDVAETDEAIDRFERLVEAMGGVDLVVLSAAVGELNDDLDWPPERETVDVNVRGFAGLAVAAMAHFEQRGAGHLVGISSVAGNFGNAGAPAYNASKAFVSRYLEGLRYRAANSEADVTVTTIEPGFVDTDLALGEDQFWMASPETAARQIRQAIDRKRTHAYVTRRWRAVAWLLRALPESVLKRLFA